MSSSEWLRRRVVLTGARKGHTGPIGSHHAVDGVISLEGVPKDILAWEHHLSIMFQAYPEGDPRIAEQEAAIAAAHAAEGTQPPETSHVERSVQEDGNKPHGQADVSGGGESGGGGAEAGGAANLGGDAAGDATGGSDASGSLGDGSAPQLTPVIDERLARAVASLVPTEDSHWTKDGKPMLSAVEKYYGSTGLTRADVEAVAPGFRRAATA